jgi:hypothetical protein
VAISVDTLLANLPEALNKPVRTRTDREAMRPAPLADPGAVHGDIAERINAAFSELDHQVFADQRR